MSQRTVMPYSATPPKPAITRASSGSLQLRQVADRAEGHARAVGAVTPEIVGVERLDLEPVDADHGVAVVHQVVREREARRPHADHEHALAGCGERQRTRAG